MPMGRLTAIAVTKLLGRFPKPNAFELSQAQAHDTKVCVMKMNGIMASSSSLSAVNWDANLVKTGQEVSIFHRYSW